MTVRVVLGAQFGDESKGKIADFLAGTAKFVVRTGGGPNTGHTIVLSEGKVVLHQIACGVLRGGVTGISGPGMVLQPMKLEEELQELESRNLLKGKFEISERAHVLLPIHEMEDAWEDELRARKGSHSKLGTTHRGVGPAYADRYARFGLRMSDLVRPGLLRERLELLYETKTYLPNLPSIDKLTRTLTEVGERLAPYIQPTEPQLWEALERGESILLEGAQSALLDIDYGTYPYVTSSHPTAAGALMGSGIPPQELDEVIGVAKAYMTRVGEGPFPTEVAGETATYLQREGGERGATTGRVRRVGWLDLVLLKYVARLNGFTSLAIAKADVLGGLDEVPICVQYASADGSKITSYPPAVAEELGKVKPIYQQFPGWPSFTTRLKDRLRRDGPHALPAPLRRFLSFIADETGVPVEFVSFGPHRDETIWMGRGAPARRANGLSPWSR
ncbi:MAG: adenylosuccinate synthase [Thermoplasmata archaeon]